LRAYGSGELPHERHFRLQPHAELLAHAFLGQLHERANVRRRPSAAKVKDEVRVAVGELGVPNPVPAQAGLFDIPPRGIVRRVFEHGATVAARRLRGPALLVELLQPLPQRLAVTTLQSQVDG